MATGAFQILQKSLLEARKDLDSTNDSIKKLTGYEPKSRNTPGRGAGGPSRTGGLDREPISRRLSSGDSRPGRSRQSGNMRAWSGSVTSPTEGRKRDRPVEGRSRLAGRLGSSGDLDLSENKRRDPFGGKSRLAGRLGPPVNWEEKRREKAGELDSEGEEGEIVDRASKKNPPVQSSVVAMAVPPRPKADPNEDEQSKHRNRRMFGFLMNTLRKFKDTEATAKSSEKERRRSEIEDKLQKTQEMEKEAAQQEKKELFDQQKAQKIKISTIAKQMELVDNYKEWNEHDKMLLGYIETRSKPRILYLPKEHIPKTEELVSKTRQKVEDKINKRKKEVDSFLEAADTVKSDNSKGVDDRDDPVGAGVEEGGRGKGGSENGDVSD